MRLGKSDKAVIKAFLDQRPLDGHKLSTDGKRLDGHWMGGNKIAAWKGDKIDLPDTGSRAGQTVQSAVRREAPKKWIADNPDKPGPDNPIYVRGLGHVYIDSDDYLMLSDGRGSVGRIVSGTIKPSRDLGGAEASRLLAAFAEFGSPAKTTKRGGKKKNPSRASGRARNSHDSNQSARVFKAAVEAAERELLTANDNLERKKAAASIKALVRAAYWIGEASAERGYARSGVRTLSIEEHERLDKRLREMRSGMENWGKNFEDAMAG